MKATTGATTTRSRLTTLCLLAAGVLAAGLPAAAPPANANDPSLGLPDFGAIAVDQTHRHVFVTGGPSANSIVVTNLSGDVVKRIDGEFGATGLVLGADGGTLYAALAGGDAIAAIDTTTLTETARYATPAQTCPTTLARTGRYVWFGYGCAGSWSGGIGRLDTAASPPAVTLNQQGTATFQGAPLVSAATADTGPVVAGQPHLSLSDTDVYTVAGGALQPGASGTVAGSNLVDQALSPDGSLLLTAAGSQNGISGFATTDLSGRGAYGTGHYPNAVEVSPDGQYLAAGAVTNTHRASIYRLGATTPVRTIDLDGANTADGGLAWSTDSKLLFLVTQPITATTPTLHVIKDPTR
ncbi:MAG: hypothetical protein ACJ73S_27155 [Mycobacteriales bacterium]